MRIPRGGVAFFDSGIGGLTVMAACRGLLPSATFYYYGDNRHAPYGNLPPRKIKKYVLRAFRRFERLKVKAAVVACNTATALCVEELRALYPFPVIGAEPAVFLAAKEGGEIFALSTRATYESARYQALCKRAAERYPSAKIRCYPCDFLAGEIEDNLGKKGADFTKGLPRGSPKTVVLGCTHYPYAKGQIEGFYRCKVIDGNEGIARRLKSVLEGENLPQNDQNHSRPPSAPFHPEKGERGGRKVEKGRKGLLREKRNKRSFFAKAQNAESQKRKGEGKIFFLGSSKKRNKKVYKQTFV